MKSNDLFYAIGEVDDDLIDACMKKKRYPVWIKWGALAACLCLMVITAGSILNWRTARYGGSNINHAAGSGVLTYMSYEGPVFPLAVLDHTADLTAERKTDFDFSHYKNDHYTAASNVTDSYVLTNHSREDKTVSILYPFASNLNNLAASPAVNPASLSVNGTEVQTSLYAGSYAGSYSGAIGSEESEPLLNLSDPSGWEDYKTILSDGSYLSHALEESLSLSGTTVTVYKFTNPWDNGEDAPNPSIRVGFDLDYEKTIILTYGFSGASYDYNNGSMIQEFSVPHQQETTYYMIVLGENIRSLTSGCYVTGGTDPDTKQMEGGVTIECYEMDLDDILREIAGMMFDNLKLPGKEEKIGFELYYRLFCEWLIADGPLSDSGIARYGCRLEENDVCNSSRIFYLSALINIPAGSSTTVTANLVKNASTDYMGDSEFRNGYDMVTRLGSSLDFTKQEASISNTEGIEIIRQNFGFDLENGITGVELDMNQEHYFMDIRWKTK